MFNKKLIIDSLKNLSKPSRMTNKNTFDLKESGSKKEDFISAQEGVETPIYKAVKTGVSPIEGKGLFAEQSIRKGDIIGVSHIRKKFMKNGEEYEAPFPSTVLGYYNHSEEPNVYEVDKGDYILMVAGRDIQRGHEITSNYNKHNIKDLEVPDDFKKGGSIKRPSLPNRKSPRSYSRSFEATNKLFAKNPLFAKAKSRKNKIFDPRAQYYDNGGASGCPQGMGWSIKDNKCIKLLFNSNTLTDIKNRVNSTTGIPLTTLSDGLKIKPLNSFSDFGKEKPIPVREDSFIETLETDVNDFLGKPLVRAAQIADNLAEKGEDSSDPLRHSTAGALTAQTIANKTGNIPFISNPLGYLGANIAGIGHELSTLYNTDLDDRPWSVKLQESLEDIYNNSVGASTIFNNKSEKDKINYLLHLTRTNQLPDGYGEERPFKNNPKWTDPYNKKQYGGLNNFAEGGASGCPPKYYWNGTKCVKKPKNSFVTSDFNKYEERKAAYDDSLKLYNAGNKESAFNRRVINLVSREYNRQRYFWNPRAIPTTDRMPASINYGFSQDLGNRNYDGIPLSNVGDFIPRNFNNMNDPLFSAANRIDPIYFNRHSTGIDPRAGLGAGAIYDSPIYKKPVQPVIYEKDYKNRVIKKFYPKIKDPVKDPVVPTTRTVYIDCPPGSVSNGQKTDVTTHDPDSPGNYLRTITTGCDPVKEKEVIIPIKEPVINTEEVPMGTQEYPEELGGPNWEWDKKYHSFTTPRLNKHFPLGPLFNGKKKHTFSTPSLHRRKDYKEGGISLQLTKDEIQKYVDGGYVVEDLPKANKGKISKTLKKITRSNYNPLSIPIKKIGERIARQHSSPSRSRGEIATALFKPHKYTAKYFGQASTLPVEYGIGKRDLIANYFSGNETGFEPIDYDIKSDSGLFAAIEEYGPLKTYMLNSAISHGESLDFFNDIVRRNGDRNMFIRGADGRYIGNQSMMAYHKPDYPFVLDDMHIQSTLLGIDRPLSQLYSFELEKILELDPQALSEFSYKTKQSLNQLFEQYGKDSIPFEIDPLERKPNFSYNPQFKFGISPVGPRDNVGGHMAFLQRTPEKEFQLTTRDLWGFRPEAYDKKWGMYNSFLRAQTQLMDAFGKPFVLTQTNPIKLKQGGESNYELGDEVDEETKKYLESIGYTFETI